MKKNFLLAACLLSLFIPLTVFAANVTKVVITAVEPMVGERQSYHCLGDKKDYIRAHKVLPIVGFQRRII